MHGRGRRAAARPEPAASRESACSPTLSGTLISVHDSRPHVAKGLLHHQMTVCHDKYV